MNIEEDFMYKLDTLKLMNLKAVEIDQIKQVFLNLHEQIAVTNILKKGTEICRTVVVNDLENLPKHVSQISYNPNPSANLGRAHLIGETVFYGSVSTETMKHYNNTSFEVFDLNNTSLERQYFITSKWILQQDLTIIVVGSNLLHINKETEEREQFLQGVQPSSEEMIMGAKFFDDFIASEFSKVVPRGSEFLYKISASYCSWLFSLGIHGILYSSVGSNGHGLNVALKPSLVDDGILVPQVALFGTLYNRYGEYADEYSMKANIVNEFLRWENVDYLLPLHMKRYYTGRSDDKSFQEKIIFDDLGNIS